MRSPLILLWILLVGGSLSAQTFLLETFDNGIDTTAGGWTIVDGGGSSDTWFGTVGGNSGSYLDGTEFAFVNSDAAGPGSILLEEQLVSPVLNTAGVPLLFLEFEHYYRSVVLTDSGFVDVWDGSQWVTIDTMVASRGSFVTPAVELYDITAYANANLQIRFVYDDDSTWAWWWALDNVRVFNPPNDDAAVTSILTPFGGGRANSSSAMTPTETISAEVINLGSDTLVNVPISFAINQVTIATETIPGPLIPNILSNYTFTATGNFGAVNQYTLEVWTGQPNDANPGNDTASAVIRQLANLPVILPICEDFDAMPDTAFLGAGFALPGVEALDYTSNNPAAGRLRTFAGSGYANSGQRAITLDRSSSGPLVKNELIFTYNLIGYDVNNDQVTMDVALMDNGDEVHVGDSIWVRGCDTCDWVQLLAWNDITGSNNNGQYFFISGLDLSAALFFANQNFSSSTQIRIGQEDNFPSTSTTASDGLTVDDLCLNIELDTNVAMVEILSPEMGDCGDSSALVRVVVENMGKDSVANVPVFATVSGAVAGVLNGISLGPLASGERDTVTFNTTINTYLGGTIGIVAYTALSSDPLQIDDTLAVSRSINPVPEAPNIQGDTLVCFNTSSTLSVQSPVPGLGYVWYDASGTNVLHVGNTFVTPPITGPTTYEVEPGGNIPYNVGPADNSGPGANYTTYTDGMIFNVLQELTIDSMDVYPDDSGDVALVIEDGQGQLVTTILVPVDPTNPGDKVTIPIGLTLAPGNGYRATAVGTTTNGLWRNDGGKSFPYAVPGVVEITQTINGLHTSGYYYFFYNWQITARGCPGTRTTVAIDTFAFVPTSAGFASTPNGLSVDFTATTNNGIGFFWDFGDGNTDSIANPTHQYATPGSFQVCLIVDGPCISDTFCDFVNVTCAPLVTDYGFLENGLQVDFTDQTPGSVNWVWDFGDGTVDSVANPSHTFMMDGTYIVCLTTTDACGQQDQFCDTLEVCAPLNPGIIYTIQGGTLVDFTSLTLGTPTSYFWEFGDGGTSNSQNPSYIYLSPSTYTVTLTMTNICGDTMSISETIMLVGLDNALSEALEVFPNPNAGRFSVVLPEWGMGVAQLTLLDAWGRKVWERNGVDEKEIEVQVGELARGAYWLRVEMDGAQAIRAIRVQ